MTVHAMIRRTLGVWLGVGLNCVVSHAAAEPAMMTRQQIIDIAASGVGNGYKWGFAHWNSDGTGKNEHACVTAQCTDCCCVKLSNNKSGCKSGTKEVVDGCKNYYPVGAPGADCSGYVAKCWQVPGKVSVSTNSHPYSTKNFHDDFTSWTAVERADLKRGDALVYRNDEDNGGHIVLFDSDTGNTANQQPQYWVYEAKGCASGVKHNVKAMDASYIGIRRNSLEDFECKDDACNHHGTCNTETGCSCDSGYEGTNCERCELGFVGYPTCTRADSMCKLSGTISCEMKPIRLTPQQGTTAMSDYACGERGLSGGELAFRFEPPRTGKATVSLEGASDAGTRLLLLRGACAPEGCVKADARSLELEFGGGEVFFVALDTRPGATGDVTLKVDCKRDEQAFIGDPCNDAGDCAFMSNGQSGFCYDTGEGGFCALPCTKYCPDVPGVKAPTFCIGDPKNTGSGVCVPKPDSVNQRCAALPGTAANTVARFNDSATSEACVPGASAPVCSGGFTGRVVDAVTSQPLANARIAVEGGTAMMLQTDANGEYKTETMPCGSYTLRISADGYAPVNAGLQVSADNETQMAALHAVATATCSNSGQVRGLVFDAISQERKPIANAKVTVRAGVGQGIGPISVEAITGPDGVYLTQGLPAGTYTIAAGLAGYQSASVTLGVCGAAEPQTQDLGLTTVTGSPFRAVLRWSKPDDLDLHLQTPQGDEVYFYTPCRGSLDRSPFALLDVDRRHAEGPEVVSVSSLLPGRYTLFVHNYSAQTQNDPTQLPESSAEVVVYGPGDQVLGTYEVPSSGSGLFWDVVSFDGADPTKLTPIQRLTNRPDPETQYAQDCRP